MGWIGVDFDRTLATYEHLQWPRLGDPIPAMVRRVRTWLTQGYEVRIVTARVSQKQTSDALFEQIALLNEWCVKHIGHALPLTAEKDFEMICLYDDRAVQVLPNTGELIGQEFNLNDPAS